MLLDAVSNSNVLKAKVYYILGNMVTVMGADGKPMQVNSNALQQGGIPNGNGTVWF